MKHEAYPHQPIGEISDEPVSPIGDRGADDKWGHGDRWLQLEHGNHPKPAKNNDPVKRIVTHNTPHDADARNAISME